MWGRAQLCEAAIMDGPNCWNRPGPRVAKVSGPAANTALSNGEVALWRLSNQMPPHLWCLYFTVHA